MSGPQRPPSSTGYYARLMVQRASSAAAPIDSPSPNCQSRHIRFSHFFIDADFCASDYIIHQRAGQGRRLHAGKAYTLRSPAGSTIFSRFSASWRDYQREIKAIVLSNGIT